MTILKACIINNIIIKKNKKIVIQKIGNPGFCADKAQINFLKLVNLFKLNLALFLPNVKKFRNVCFNFKEMYAVNLEKFFRKKEILHYVFLFIVIINVAIKNLKWKK